MITTRRYILQFRLLRFVAMSMRGDRLGNSKRWRIISLHAVLKKWQPSLFYVFTVPVEYFDKHVSKFEEYADLQTGWSRMTERDTYKSHHVQSLNKCNSLKTGVTRDRSQEHNTEPQITDPGD